MIYNVGECDVLEVMSLILQYDITPSLKLFPESMMETGLILAFDRQMFSRHPYTVEKKISLCV